MFYDAKTSNSGSCKQGCKCDATLQAYTRHKELGQQARSRCTDQKRNRDLACVGLCEVIKRFGVVDISFRNLVNLVKNQQPPFNECSDEAYWDRDGPQTQNVLIFIEAGASPACSSFCGMILDGTGWTRSNVGWISKGSPRGSGMNGMLSESQHISCRASEGSYR